MNQRKREVDRFEYKVFELYYTIFITGKSFVFSGYLTKLQLLNPIYRQHSPSGVVDGWDVSQLRKTMSNRPLKSQWSDDIRNTSLCANIE